MTLEITDEEARIIDAGLVERAESLAKLARALRKRRGRLLDSLKARVELAEGLRRKLLVAQYGEKRAAEIVAERATVPTLEELYNGVPARCAPLPDAAADRKPDAAQGAADRDGGEPSGGLTCHGTGETIPFCNGVDCPDWGDCHGDRLRGFSASASNWREGCGL